jgi:hypothetical protein
MNALKEEVSLGKERSRYEKMHLGYQYHFLYDRIYRIDQIYLRTFCLPRRKGKSAMPLRREIAASWTQGRLPLTSWVCIAKNELYQLI